MTRIQRMDIGQLMADHLTLDHALEVLLHPLSGDSLLEQRIVLGGVGDEEMLEMLPLSPVRECAISQSFIENASFLS